MGAGAGGLCSNSQRDVATPAKSAGRPGMTGRALATGFAFGLILATGNVYMGLKIGWWESGGITAAVAGFALLHRRGEHTGRETVLLQTTASAAAAMPAAIGFLGAIPALAMFGREVPWWVLALWGLALGLIGILVAV